MNFFKKLFGLTDNKNNETLNYKEEIIEEPISEEPKEEMIEEPISEEPKEEMIEELILEEKENSNKIENITDNTLSLNDYQKEAVINEDDACIVSANVGSGKTTVLISKVLYLSQKYDIKDLIILTFTNKAAQEIKDRLISVNKNLTSDNLIYCDTFHSVALEKKKKELPITDLGYTNDFSVIDPEEELDMANEIIFDNNLKIKYKNKLRSRLEKEKQAYFIDQEEREKTLKSFGAILSIADKKNVLSAKDLVLRLQFRTGLEYFKNVTKQYRDGLVLEHSILQASIQSSQKKGIERQ